ncbi:MAG: kinase [Verrucomicrobiae bacterium]|nr:kinase [Verrucomicrobiae bacterium]
MVISRTPYRISFFGGGTDYPAWYRKHGGAVLSATINKYCYLTCRYMPPFHEHRIRVAYSRIEQCETIDQIEHPAVREALRFLKIYRCIEIHHAGDLPGRSGMGSSSAFTVGLLHALHALKGELVSKKQLAREGIHLEQNVLKETVGSQDQVSAAFGGLNRIVFKKTGDFDVEPLALSADRLAELNSNLMLFYTGIKRTAASVASSYATRLEEQAELLNELRRFVDIGANLLCGRDDIREFGELLDQAWHLKRQLSKKVSNAEIDALYAEARAAGAIGGKLLGAGGGGFLLLFVPPQKQRAVLRRLDRLVHVPVEFESGGSQIIFFDPGEDLSRYELRRRVRPVQFRELDKDCS